MKLHGYQQNLESQVYEAWASGARNVLLQLPTGGGKTATFTKIASDHGDYLVIIAHRMQIVSQISITLGRWGVRHNIIGQKPVIHSTISLHISELKKSYYDSQARCIVACVDTLIKMKPQDNPWFLRVGLVIQDEAHHVLRANKWGTAAELFPNAKGLYVTATPCRADGYGLGAHADGLIDTMIIGPTMRELIEWGYLSDYRIFAPPSDLDLSTVPLSAGGDYSPEKLRNAVHKSHITGDVVGHYLRIAPGKLGVTFAVDIESAQEITDSYRRAGVPAEIITSKTPDTLRFDIMRRFRNREILQLVNVDLLGEGVDVPAIEVVSMARPTQSYALFSQQFGRGLRVMPEKTHAIIIDHVGNTLRHGLPDAPRVWSLDRREKRSRGVADDVIPVRTCFNAECMRVYERVKNQCPYCGFTPAPSDRSLPEQVDGDLLELDAEALAKLRGEIKRIDDSPRVPQGLDAIAGRAVMNNHRARQEAQRELRDSIALWAGAYKTRGISDSEIYRSFYFKFGTDIMTAQTLNAKDAESLKKSIDKVSNR